MPFFAGLAEPMSSLVANSIAYFVRSRGALRGVGLLAVAAALTALASGCQAALKQKGKALLNPAKMSADSCVLEIFFVRVPYGDDRVNDKLWAETDEQKFSVDLRQKLVRNGFRAGMTGPQLPVVLTELMELADKPAPEAKSEEMKVDVTAQPNVTRRHIQIRAGQRGEVTLTKILDQLPLLIKDGDQLRGETFNQAQGVLAVKTFPESDGGVRVEMTPEVQYGQSRQRWIVDQDVVGQSIGRLDASRPKYAFNDLTMKTTLQPGSVFVMTCLPKREGSAGHHLFTEENSCLDQKLLILRLSQTQHDDLFEPNVESDVSRSPVSAAAPTTVSTTIPDAAPEK